MQALNKKISLVSRKSKSEQYFKNKQRVQKKIFFLTDFIYAIFYFYLFLFIYLFIFLHNSLLPPAFPYSLIFILENTFWPPSAPFFLACSLIKSVNGTEFQSIQFIIFSVSLIRLHFRNNTK